MLRIHNQSLELRALAYARSAQDIVWWTNNWVWTYDPRLPVAYIPFNLFPIQEEVLRWLEIREGNQEDGLIVKSRDLGVTWLAVTFLTHRWLFSDGFKGGVGSRKLDLVDKLGDPDSILEKVRLLIRRLPIWFYPPGFRPEKDMGYCKISNPYNGNTITGEGGDQIGRGGRSSIYFVDEAAFLEHPKAVDAALSQNTNVRIDLSTPHGVGNSFYEKYVTGITPSIDIGWEDDPRKNHWEVVNVDTGDIHSSGGGPPPRIDEIPVSHLLRFPWYEAEKIRLNDPVLVAQELDRDFTASLEGIIIPATWVKAAVDLDKRMSLIRRNTSPDIVTGLDIADGGDCKTVLTVRQGPVISRVYERQEGNTTDIAHWARDLSLQHKAKFLNYDSVGVGAGVGGAYKALARTKRLGITIRGINAGTRPTDAKWPDGRTSKEFCFNLKAELWWRVRRRFEKTWELVEFGIQHPLDELISIPNHPQLIRELSNVLHFTTETGKIQVEKKEAMRKRGVRSPDFAESLMLSFAPTPRPIRTAVGGERKLLKAYKPV